MNITVLSHTFSPDHSGISNYATGFATFASENGHSVEVITSFPFYPQWRKRKEDKRKLFSTEIQGKIRIFRGNLYVPANPTLIKRLFNEFTFLNSTLINFFRITKPDVIVVFTTPISIGFLAVLFKFLFRCKVVINVQDFQLEAASSLSMVNQNIFFNLLKKAEQYSYKKADLVTTISKSMYQILLENKHIPIQRTYLWPNWVNLKDYDISNSEKGIFRSSYGYTSEDILVAYAGNLGLKQGLESIIDLAVEWQHNKKVKFIIIGQGAALENLKKYSQERSGINLKFIPLLNSKEYIDFLSDLNVFYLPQKKTDFDVYFPSKLLGLMAAKKTLLLAADKESELYRTVSSYKIGFVAEYGDIKTLAQLLNTIILQNDAMKEVHKNMEEYIANFQTEVVLSNVMSKIESIVKNESATAKVLN